MQKIVQVRRERAKSQKALAEEETQALLREASEARRILKATRHPPQLTLSVLSDDDDDDGPSVAGPPHGAGNHTEKRHTVCFESYHSTPLQIMMMLECPFQHGRSCGAG